MRTLTQTTLFNNLYQRGGEKVSTYEALDVMLNFGILIFAMLAYLRSTTKKR
ncbi:putative holin-like toxin [Paenibacillus xylanexedens]|uniref:putative holin-like toxin n=1 Tax=Paenibacillus xylanexedens TaxID=528191 RepID=UPI0039EFFFA1